MVNPRTKLVRAPIRAPVWCAAPRTKLVRGAVNLILMTMREALPMGKEPRARAPTRDQKKYSIPRKKKKINLLLHQNQNQGAARTNPRTKLVRG